LKIYIEMKDKTKIVRFKWEDEFCIRQQIFMQYGYWPTLKIDFPVFKLPMPPKRRWFTLKEEK